MQHRHLLPNEIDLLLDGEVGFGVAPLRAHVDECADCRALVERARTVMDALDNLPRFAPVPSFANRVMAQVQVVEPWHVAVLAAARRLVPRTTGMRVVMGASASLLALAVSTVAVWLSFRTDVAMYIAGLADQRLRAAVTSGAAELARSVLGAGAMNALSSEGATAVAVGAAVLVVAAGSAALGIRAMALASRRTRE